MITNPQTTQFPFSQTFFSFMTPFTPGLWVVLICAVVYSAIIFWVLERNVNEGYTCRSAREGIEIATFQAAAKITWSGHFGLPASTSGRMFAI
eukprot:CAMPEP_0173410814 /NCGR_PEP_ID=MMETSP1356-20130122/75464_1 /TAXON_ID=77927 ORGANISM="Hemiselmis virescens, Strain PCC157" /NCGR_SAMPLE_ID=MMETSP1356 /ASSEMBLY_ACC=CAM_ASM_000847 /LENGTH=92 /DNA_ID=CAMNT_0014372475 /DNA_START=35 /DNA_END=310 /DNA_ORIENTATION=-